MSSLIAFFFVAISKLNIKLDLEISTAIDKLLYSEDSRRSTVLKILLDMGIQDGPVRRKYWSGISISPEMLSHMMAFKTRMDERVEVLHYVFDFRLRELAQLKANIDPRLSHFSAVFANSIAPSILPLVDEFCITGELFWTMGRERWGRKASPKHYASQIHPDMGIALKMRNVLREGSFKEMLREPPRNLGRAIVLCDFSFSSPHSPAMRVVRRSFDLNTGLDDPMILWNTIEKYRHSLVVAVIPGAARNGPRSKWTSLRRELVTSGRLRAVIDMPGNREPASMRSIWILSGHDDDSRPRSDAVLMVNLRKLGVPESLHDFGLYAEFGARLFLLFEGKRLLKRWASADFGGYAEKIREIFDREFGDFYEDVDGLCRKVSRDALVHRPDLIASAHLDESRSDRSLLSIDFEPIVHHLNRASSRSVVYVIGNNGEGKSLMLRDLAERYSREGRQVVGISFGSSDRFPVGRSELADFPGFKYEGARDPLNNSNVRKQGSGLVRKLFNISEEASRFSVFRKLIARLGFNPKVFLMVSNEAKLPITSELASSILELSSDQEENQRIRSLFGPKVLQPAFIRGKKGGIVKFADLSSGEQQVLSLAIKVVANANAGTLILVDEPEISLHVSWQKSLPTLLETVLSQYDCDIVVATHSPLVISSATGASDHCFVTQRQRLEPIRTRDLHSVESVLFSGFKTYTSNNRLVHERCAGIVAEAMEAANQLERDEGKLIALRTELSAMRRVVEDKREMAAGVESSLMLIQKAEEAVEQIRSWNSGAAKTTIRG
ncbi:UNVERIFIED_ORG: putative AbiEii toxin of type IV toxin-antitoxin system [Herbaspirillum seropedicae]